MKIKMTLAMACLMGLLNCGLAAEEEGAGASCDFNKHSAKGMKMLTDCPDGKTERATIDGSGAVKIVPCLKPDGKYLYFKIDASNKWLTEAVDLAVLVSYYDYQFGAENNFWIEYENRSKCIKQEYSDGRLEYYNSGEIRKTTPKYMHGTRWEESAERHPAWKDTVFIIRGLKPGSDKLNGADFRIAANNFLAVANISVVPLPGMLENNLSRRERILDDIRTSHLKMMIVNARADFAVRRSMRASAAYPEIPCCKEAADMERALKEISRKYDAFISQYGDYFSGSEVDCFKGNVSGLNQMCADLQGQLDILSDQTSKLLDRASAFQKSLQESLAQKKELAWRPRARVVLGPLPDEKCRRFKFGDGFYYGSFIGPWACGRADSDESIEYARMLGVDIAFIDGGHQVEKDGWSTASNLRAKADYYWCKFNMYIDFILTAHTWAPYGGFPAWLEKEYGNDLYAVAEDGKQHGGGYGAIEVSHPAVLDYLDRYADALGRALKGSSAVFYRYAWEPHYDAGHGESGYGKIAETAFHKYLQENYKTIENLNLIWGSNYESFDAVKPPADVARIARRKSTPLVYEWEKWRRDVHTEYQERFSEALRRADPGVYTYHESFFIYNGLIKQALDQYRQCATADILNVHGSLWQDQYLTYVYSLNRYFNKITVDGEPCSLGGADSYAADPGVLRRAMEVGTFKQSFWGKRYLSLWLEGASGVEGPKRRGYEGKLYNDYIAVFPLVKERADYYGNLFLHTKIADVEVGVLMPYASNFNAWPYQLLMDEMPTVAEWLAEANYNYFIVPEQSLLDGKESLAEFKVLIIPYAPLLDEKASEKIRQWVEAGGTLLTSGPAGVMNPLGKADGRLLKKAFGEFSAQYGADEVSLKHKVKEGRANPIWEELHIPPSEKLAGWYWDISFTKINPNAKILLSLENGAPALMEAPLGKGRIITSAVSLTYNYFRGFLINQAARAISTRSVIAAPEPYVSVNVRRAQSGQMYVFAFNNNPREKWQGTIAIKGLYRKVIDLSMPGGLPLPLKHDPSGYTLVNIMIDMGDWAVLAPEDRAGGKPADTEPSLLADMKNDAGNVVARANKLKADNTIDGSLRQSLGSIASRLLTQGQYQRAQKTAQLALGKGKIASPVRQAADISVTAARVKNKINLDGDLMEWSDLTFQDLSGGDVLVLRDIDALLKRAREDEKPSNRASFSLQWDNDNLYLAVKVCDAEVMSEDNPSEGVHWRYSFDGVRLYFGVLDKEASLTTIGETRYGDGDLQICIDTTGRKWVSSPIGSTMGGLCSAVKKDETGYTMEIAVPLKDLHLFPVPGHKIRFQLHAMDNKRGSKIWSKEAEAVSAHTSISADGWGRLVFGD